MECKTYSDKSFAVYGETKEYKETLKSFGGKWNQNLKDGAGWIFPNSKRSQVNKWLKSVSSEGAADSGSLSDVTESGSEYTSDLETVTMGISKDGTLNQIRIEKCFMVTGDRTKNHKDDLKKLGGSWISSLKGWVFPEANKDNLTDWIDNLSLNETGSVSSVDKVSDSTDEEPVTITDYSEKAILVSGGTKRYKDELKTLGGKWNSTLKGWIFPKTVKGKVEKWLSEK